MSAKKQPSTLASNRKARHDFSILEVFEAGIVLSGSEVKSLRTGQVQLADSYARMHNGELWLEGVHVAPYQFAHGVGAHDPNRPRKLLLHAAQLQTLSDRVARERLTIVPLSIYLKDGRVKVEIALARGKRREDKRQDIAKRDVQREIQRNLGRQEKGKS